MGLVSALFLLGAPVLPWLGLVTAAIFDGLAFPVFGAQATLWDLAGAAQPLSVNPAVPTATGILLLAAGLLVLVRVRAGAVVALAALVTFVAGTWGLLGAHAVGPALTVVALGPGIWWAVAGLASASVAYCIPSRSFGECLRSLRDSRTLAPIGSFLAAGFLAIDAADHASGGNALAIFGDGAVEPVLHALFIVPVAALVALHLAWPGRMAGRLGGLLIGLATLGLALDAIFHVATGSVSEMLGHTVAEMTAHIATYYGVALLAVSRFVLGTP